MSLEDTYELTRKTFRAICNRIDVGNLARIANSSVLDLAETLHDPKQSIRKGKCLREFVEKFTPISEKAGDPAASFGDYESLLFQMFAGDVDPEDFGEDGCPKKSLEDLKRAIAYIKEINEGKGKRTKEEMQGTVNFLRSLARYICRVSAY
jgi:hypothetical protein